ncbi:hypothetical protein CACET_c18190 [Clostridium aceticum]|uniref:Uncharacterized protein n=1 Tax=Clostridium aceticum TaxID=84022 RepID=A0A0D8IDQ5_9CLOT|nr:hypothetical protein [Clostridium aceticum]AKL95267.1 hypothetical protein CACET_c18190 [Clostridium aceticum]KJF28117.1 hypothetical protein TZ02_06115 [Clostridium aceticum]
MDQRKAYLGERICRKCKKMIHEKSLHDYCPACYKKVEDIFNRIREYLRKYPGATAFEMEQRLDIPIHVINNFVKDGRLVEIPNAYLNMECLRCGCLLISAHHKYCPTCEEAIKRDLEKAKESLRIGVENNEAAGAKMRYKTHIRKND